VTRQFLSKDLSRNDGEQSAYQYCFGNPVFRAKRHDSAARLELSSVYGKEMTIPPMESNAACALLVDLLHAEAQSKFSAS
jgi:hypothetical protein